METEQPTLSRAFEVKAGPRHRLVARSRVMFDLVAEARRIASVPRPILIRGERGVGKEIIAAILHYESDRAAKRFVVVNCAAMHPALLSSELFGHERGAFTGAVDRRKGKFEQADGGTLFLDEVGNMPAMFQERILRVLEYQEFERVGGSVKVRTDVRVLAATNSDLEEMMERGDFRRDLYDRLAFHTLEIPPLRKRREDIALLISHFKHCFLEEVPNFEDKLFIPSAMREMLHYYWPGNVRQLKAVVESLLCRDIGPTIEPEELPPEIIQSVHRNNGLGLADDQAGNFEERVTSFQRRLIAQSLAEHGTQRKASQQLGMSYDQFRHYYRKFQLDKKDGRNG